MKPVRLSFLYLCFTFFPLMAQSQGLVTEYKSFQLRYDSLLSMLNERPSDTLSANIYNELLRFQNAKIDKEVLLRQKLRHADAATLRLFKTRDSLLNCLGREYERPIAQRRPIDALESQAADLEQQILSRVERDMQYFQAMSLPFSKQVYDSDPTLKCLMCYLKIRLHKGNSKLASQLYAYSRKKTQSKLRWQQVRDELNDSELALEFVAYRDKKTNGVRYGAFLLRRGYAAPRWLSLFSQSDLDEFLQQTGVDDEYEKQQLYFPQANGEVASLYNLIWAPLEPFAKNVKKVYYAPAGDLHRLNIAAISPEGQSAPLQDRHEFIRINSTRSLINSYGVSADKKAEMPLIKLPCISKIVVDRELTSRFFGSIEVDYSNSGLAPDQKDAMLFGNINYDMDSLAIKNPGLKQNRVTPTTVASSPARKRQFTKGVDWETLYGAKTEVEMIQKQLAKSAYKVSVLEGYAASEEAFKMLGKEAASPRILHIATHGFFLADASQEQADNPMNRSGLILAGANYAWKKGMPLKGMEDGILTAFEISHLSLENTELVVLSACETGLGYIINNEGVFGLQRAFKQAGVRNLMVSLWSIPDNATQLLMTKFYENCLEKDMSMRDALKAAQQWMRTQENLKNPYYWAGFVLLE